MHLSINDGLDPAVTRTIHRTIFFGVFFLEGPFSSFPNLQGSLRTAWLVLLPPPVVYCFLADTETEGGLGKEEEEEMGQESKLSRINCVEGQRSEARAAAADLQERNSTTAKVIEVHLGKK